MKYFQLFTILLCLIYAQCSIAQAVSVNLTISNIPKSKGTLMVAWYNKKADFLNPTKTTYHHMAKMDGQSSITIVFPAIESGEYSISMFFDENNNGIMDTNLFGIPTEEYGFSNNKYFATRATTFEEAKFKVSQSNQTITIRMK